MELLKGEDINTLLLLRSAKLPDGKCYLNSDAIDLLQGLEERYNAIKDTYVNLNGKPDKTPEEDQLLSSCSENLVLVAEHYYNAMPNIQLQAAYDEMTNEKKDDPLIEVKKKAAIAVMQARGLTVPRFGRV